MDSKSDRLLRRTAIHEAGHAVMAVHLGIRLVEVTIDPEVAGRGDLGATCRERVHLLTETTEENLALVSLGGPAAERLAFGDAPGNAQDHAHATRRLPSADRVREFAERAEQFLSHPRIWPQVEAVARHLLARGTLAGEEVRALVELTEN